MTHYRRNLRSAVASSAGPYGYTLTIWTTGAVLTHNQGVPTSFYAAAFMAGAVLAFASVAFSAFGGLRGQLTAPREQGPEAVFASAHVFAVGFSIGAAALVANYVGGFIAWPLAGFLSTAIFLLVLGGESTAAYLWANRAAGEEAQS